MSFQQKIENRFQHIVLVVHLSIKKLGIVLFFCKCTLIFLQTQGKVRLGCFNEFVEISWFLYTSNFTWNQFLVFYKWKSCRFNTFRGSELRFLWIYEFLDFLKAEIYQINKIQSPQKCAKMADLELLDSVKLISRKI